MMCDDTKSGQNTPKETKKTAKIGISFLLPSGRNITTRLADEISGEGHSVNNTVSVTCSIHRHQSIPHITRRLIS